MMIYIKIPSNQSKLISIRPETLKHMRLLKTTQLRLYLNRKMRGLSRLAAS